MTVTFRTAEAGDLDLLADMMRALYAHDGYAFDEDRARQALGDLVRDTSMGRVWVIRDGETAIGYVVLTLGYSLEYHGRDAFVDEIYIAPSHRGRGIATQALRMVEAACRDLGVQALHLEVERANAPAQALYRKLGFEDHDRFLMTRWVQR